MPVTGNGRSVSTILAKGVLNALAMCADPDGTNARPGLAHLSTSVGCSEIAAKRALAHLEALELVVVVRRGGRHGATHYRLALARSAPRLADQSDRPPAPLSDQLDAAGSDLRDQLRGTYGISADPGPCTAYNQTSSTTTAPRAYTREAASSSRPARGKFPAELTELRQRLWHLGIQPKYNLSSDQLEDLLEDLERCGAQALAKAAYVAGDGRQTKLGHWTGLLGTFAAAMPPPPPPNSPGVISPGDAVGTGAPVPVPTAKAIAAETRALLAEMQRDRKQQQAQQGRP
jgi:hypothetical protein